MCRRKIIIKYFVFKETHNPFHNFKSWNGLSKSLYGNDNKQLSNALRSKN